MIKHRVESLMCQFDVLRHQHYNCGNRTHYIIFFDGMFFILHSEDYVEYDDECLMSSVKIHGMFFTDSQRATLIERLTNLLKESL